MIVIQTNSTKVVVGFVLDTTIESFDEDAQAAFTTGLRAVLPCHEPACAIDLVISPGSVQVDAILSVFEAEAEAGSAGDSQDGGSASLGDASQGGTAYEQLAAHVVAAAHALSSAPAGAAALELSSRLGVAVQSLPSVTVEELPLTLTLTLTLSLTLTRRRANPSPSPSPNPSANANQKKSFVRGRGTSNRTQSFFCPVAGCHNVLQHQHLSVR